MTHTELLSTDPAYAALSAQVDRLGNELDAANDGALHHAYDRETADRMLYAINRKYDIAVKSFNVYRSTI